MLTELVMGKNYGQLNKASQDRPKWRVQLSSNISYTVLPYTMVRDLPFLSNECECLKIVFKTK